MSHVRSESARLIVASDLETLSRFDLPLCTCHTYIINRDDWHKYKSLEHGCNCAAADESLSPTVLLSPLRG